jgi:flavodoxin
VVARLVQQEAGGDLVQIEAAKAYPKDHTETTNVAQDELRSKARPEIVGGVKDFSSYEVILLGYPN